MLSERRVGEVVGGWVVVVRESRWKRRVCGRSVTVYLWGTGGRQKDDRQDTAGGSVVQYSPVAERRSRTAQQARQPLQGLGIHVRVLKASENEGSRRERESKQLSEECVEWMSGWEVWAEV